ncbi:PAS domain S-box protein [Trichocoleus sp. FACHB-90]|uniref:ATP-binding protein n=1 Tax=Cyanophyceae TaxID=3028117 RepID=UPI0016884B97|nr:ATP-binding protein [Trichocoleus sp. FACHB-90]MBD1926070.1 PAS domain S-box protein [Trichocoleus sp. FACHB-90]
MGEVSTLSENLFVGGGEMGALMRSHNWSQTPLGAIETWPQSLRTIVPLVLNSRFPMVIWWGKELVLLYNDAWQPILGTKHPKALGRPGQEVWSEIWDIIGVQLNSVLETAQATWSNDMLLLVDRYGYTEETFFTYSYSPIFLETGEVGGAFTAVTETTRRVIGERRLRTLRELAASTPEAKSVEETYRVVSATLANNPYDIPFALLYLVEQDEKARLVGTVRIDAGTPASPEQVDLTQATDCWKFAQVKKTGDAEIVDVMSRFGMLSGGAWDEPSKEAIVLPIAQAGQKHQLTGFLVIGVSPRRAFDDEYRGFVDLVASNIATAIANAQAYEAERKRAEALAELDRAKTTFFSNVSHEFRTPLTLMLAPLEDTIANLKGTIPPQEHEQLLLVQRNGMRLLKLVNSLLDFSRIEAGRVQAAYEPLDLATYTAELASTFRSLIERAEMSLIVDCLPLPEAIYVDREMWEKIVLNLLSNAFKFTLSGSITVRLQWVDSQVKLSVADTGVGIPPEELPQLFERFHRVENSQGRSFEGSGIGLSLVQELVKLHGGGIAVSSTFGQGSCFTVTIPTGTAHLEPEQIGASCTLASTALGAIPYVEEAQRWLPEGDFRLPILDFELDNNSTNLNLAPANQVAQSKILLADDNADMRDYIRRLLSRSYIVQTVADGVAALSAIENNPPDLVLSDVMMPGMDGFELLRSLRSNPATQDIPIILLSARAGEEARIEGLEAGADDYLIKPFSARELLVKVEASMKLARLRQEATVRERTILGRVTDAFMAMDLDFRITYANPAAQRVSRTPLEAILGKTMWEAFPGTIGNQFEFQYRRSLSEQVAVEFEEYYGPFDLWVEVHVYPSPTGLSLFFRDINERKKVEQERERFLAVGSDLQVITGINGYFHWLSPTFERTLGWTSDEMTSRPWTEFVHPDDLSASIAETDSLFSGHETFTFENRYRHKDGSYRWLLWNAQPYPEEQVIYGVAVDITDRKQAEATLGESEARLRFMLDASQIGDWDLDLTTQPYTAHRSLRHDQIFGYESLLPEWGYDIFLTHVHPDDRASVNEKFQQTLSVNTNWNFECRIIHADQSVHWIWVRSSVYCDSSGTPTRLLGIVVDITDRKRAEQALSESEEQSRNIIESIGEAFFAADENWRLTYINQFAQTLLDRTPGDLIGKNLWEEYPGLIGSEFELVYWSAMRGVAASLTAFYPDHDRWYEARTYPAAQGITVYFRNVTDQIQAEAALRQSEERYRTLFESIDEGFCIIEMLFDANDTPIDYRFLEINPAFEQQTGLQQAVGKTVRQLIPDIEDHWIKIYGQVALTGESVRFENGSEAMNRWFDVYACRTGQPEARKVALVFKDISDRKRIEAEREQILQREQTAREAAERANRIKDEFLAVLSHELRSPLNPILGWSNLLQRGNLDATKTATALATIERNARLQSQLIDDLLDISRILSGKLSLKAMSVDLNMVISAALETVRLAAEAKSLQIKTTFSPSQGMVIGDSGRLQQVIWNLLSNAVKFTPQGGQITVRLTQTRTHAQIQVTDTGKGINPDFLPYVFEHFRQEDGATTRKFGGLGLGLAIARQVVEMHGGTVTVDSPGIGLGATFTVQIPLAPRLIESPTLDPSPVRDSDLSGIHILVVDDETDSREFVAFVLEQAGAIVTSVASGINALQAFSQSVPNIIISDIGMPVMDGYMLMRQIRALPEGKQIPAIALTAYAGEVDRQQAEAAGFQRHVAKPIDPEVVVAMVVELVSLP